MLKTPFLELVLHWSCEFNCLSTMLLYLFENNLCNTPVIVENTYTIARVYYSIGNINLGTVVAA